MTVRAFVPGWLIMVPVLLACGPLPSWAQAPMRVVAARDSVVLRTCPRSSCDVVAELTRGRAVEVLKTDGAWYQVVVTLEGRRATTGWVAIAAVASAPVATGVSTSGPARPAGTASLGERGSGPASTNPSGSDPDAPCLACQATRTATAGEWNQALAIASAVKAPVAPAITEAPPPVSVATRSRAEVVRREGRSTVERMRDDLTERFGADLKRLSEHALAVPPALQNYMSSCYDKYLPVPSVPPPGAPRVAAPPDRPRATIFDIWRGRPVFAWNETWSNNPMLSADSTAFCQTLWNRVNAIAGEVKIGVEEIESAARSADIYPGVVREVLESYGLAEVR